MRALYKYPQTAFPYEQLVAENARRTREEPEYELADTGVFDGGRYFDVAIEYAKASPEDVLVRVTISNRGPELATLCVLPTLWFRNTWSWGRGGEEHGPKPVIDSPGGARLRTHHDTLGAYELAFGAGPDGAAPELLFTDNESNARALWGGKHAARPAKDAFHEYVVRGRAEALALDRKGTKAAALYRLELAAGESVELRMRLSTQESASALSLGPEFERTFAQRADAAGQ